MYIDVNCDGHVQEFLTLFILIELFAFELYFELYSFILIDLSFSHSLLNFSGLVRDYNI